MLSSDNIFIQPNSNESKQLAGQLHQSFITSEGDLLTLINIYEIWSKTNKQSNKFCIDNYLSYRSLKYSYKIRQQLSTILSTKLSIDVHITCLPNKIPLLMCLASGLFLNIAKRTEVSMKYAINNKKSMIVYKTLRGNQDVYIHPSSCLTNSNNNHKKKNNQIEYVCYAELLVTTKSYMRNVTVIDKTWLTTVQPNLIKAINYGNSK